MSELEVVTVNKYDGTMDGLELMVILLDLKSGDYDFDITTKKIELHKNGLILSPGDYYASKPKPQKFQAIE